MNEQLQLLRQLQKLDTSIIGMSRHISSIPAKIKNEEGPLIDAKERLAGENKKLEAARKKKKDRESGIKELAEKVQKMKDRTKDLKTNKEYQTHLAEIASAEQGTGKIEEEILVLMEDIDRLEKDTKAAEAVVKSEEARIGALKKGLEAEVKREEASLKELKSSRKALASNMEKELYDEYMMRLSSTGGLAVCEAKDEVCQGCHMNIMPQMFVEMKKGEEIFRCPQCLRILFYEEKSPE